ncbi:PA0061/PA0062 family lipoprotein [Pseudomonas matsuisoli]|uniref:Lipoprotein n=1 Tax=Pseudomonas matsuisoli TaxID=1515666 RepID=A0A917PUJ6_9PSED|nr:hypothetical protein [Pseudomonas matsuisoli]GGJ93215.1 hypothetical protein GCM10009304_18880 [Pseudomonas matsuisoli]
MRVFLPLCLLFGVSGCGLMMPAHDPSQAWVELTNDNLAAIDVDQRALDDDRYFQVTPGRHELGVRYAFEVSASNIGNGAEPLPRDCRITVQYDHFDAGERYRLVTGQYGFRPWARLYDGRNRVIAQGQERGCGDPDLAVR